MAFDELSMAEDGQFNNNGIEFGGTNGNCFKKLGYLGARAGDSNPDKVQLFAAASHTEGGESSNQ